MNVRDMMSSTSMQRHIKLWAAGLVVVGCNAYDSSLLSGQLSGQVIESGGMGDAGTADQPSEEGGADNMGEAGAPVEPSAGAATSGSGPTGGVAGQSAHTDAGQGSGGSSSAGSAGTPGGSAGTPGAGGTSGTAGSANAGAANAGGSASSNAGATGSAGSGGAAHSGCALLSVPLKAKTDYSHYVITLDVDTDLSNATVSALAYAPAATGGKIYLYVQQSTFEYYAQSPQVLTGFDHWVTLSWDLSSATPSGFDKKKVRRIGIGVDAGGATAWTSPTLVYVDSIKVASPARGFQFESVSTVNTTPTNFHAGDSAIWLNNGTDDTTATGAKISWSATCK